MLNNNYYSEKSNSVEFIYTKGAENIYNSMQIHPYCELYLFINGDVELIKKNAKKRLLPYQLIIIPSGVYHKFHVLGKKEEYERCAITIYPDFINKNILESAISDKEILTLDYSDRIVKNFKYLIECQKNTSENDYNIILSAVVTDIIYLIKYSAKGKKPYDTDIKPLSKELIDYIDSNFKKQLTLEMLSQKFNYSVSHISHTFKEEFGISIKNYIIQKRLSYSRSQILQGKKPQESCIDSGFSNYTTFFKIYKKTYGLSPSKSKNK